MNVLYCCFVREPATQVVQSALENLQAAYANLSQHEVIDASDTLWILSADGGAAQLRLRTEVAGEISRFIRAHDRTVEFTPDRETQESVGLCWDALQSVVLECACPVWISERMYNADAIKQYAELRPLELITGERGFFLDHAEFEALAST